MFLGVFVYQSVCVPNNSNSNKLIFRNNFFLSGEYLTNFWKRPLVDVCALEVLTTYESI